MKNFHNKGNGECGKINQCSQISILISIWTHKRLYFSHIEVKRDGGGVYMTSSGQWVVTEVLYVTSDPKHRKAVWHLHVFHIFAAATSNI